MRHCDKFLRHTAQSRGFWLLGKLLNKEGQYYFAPKLQSLLLDLLRKGQTFCILHQSKGLVLLCYFSHSRLTKNRKSCHHFNY